MNLMLSNPYRLPNVTNDTCPCVDDYKSRPLLWTLGIVGPLFSSQTTHINKLLSPRRCPMISYGATSPELTNTEKYPDLFRTILTDDI